MPSLPALRSNGLCQEKQILIHKENQTHVNKGLSDDITYLPTVGGSFNNVFIGLTFFIVIKLKMVSDFLISLKCLAFLLCGATGFVKKNKFSLRKSDP